jgi:sialate O-acetylesterase
LAGESGRLIHPQPKLRSAFTIDAGKILFHAAGMIAKKQRLSLLLTSVFLASLNSRAEVRLHALFSSNMVLQQGMAVPVWGWADDGEIVTVKFRGQSISAKAKDGRWSLKLHSLQAGGPDVFTVSTKSNTIQLTNVLVGEVWVCSGQSNMEWPLSSAYQPEADIAASINPAIRLFTVPKLKAESPASDVRNAWKECDPQNARRFSAVAYYFGRDLQKALGVPVGLIHTSWGGSPAEAWMSRPALSGNPRYRKEIIESYQNAWQQYKDAIAKLEAGNTGSKRPTMPWKPSELYNGMIAPLIPFGIRGAIWYQGESNVGRAQQYRALFPDLIRNWRRDWGEGNFTFLCVQLAPYQAIRTEPGDSAWAELREAQLLATKVLPKVGMVVITDVGDPKDVHPRKKEPVGARLALAALGIAYGQKIEYSGPIYRDMQTKHGKAILHFDHVGKGLEARDGELKGFAICGDDRKFVWAKAEIQPNSTVAAGSPDVPKPVAVRYGWADCPVVNLWNKDGLPASPFRTDDFPLTTAGRK